jgi:hypothetical protein
MKDIKNFRYLIFLSAVVSFFIGIRFLDIGKDTMEYIGHFEKFSINNIFGKFEIGFSILMYLFSNFIPSVELFFFFISFITTTIYLYFFKKIYIRNFPNDSFKFGKTLIFFSLLLLSSWYITLTANGLRQGVALAILYHALFELFFNNNKFKFLILYLVSCLFHYSVLLVAPFVLFYYLRFRLVFAIWIITALGYLYGINELIVQAISTKFNLPVYDFIKYYSLPTETEKSRGGLYVGFNLGFFIYTVFFPLLLMVLLKVKLRLKTSTIVMRNVYNLLKIYFILSLQYFVFGFGPFSNRFAMLSWFLVPVLQFHLINTINFKNINERLCLVINLITILYFLIFTLDWIRIF